MPNSALIRSVSEDISQRSRWRFGLVSACPAGRTGHPAPRHGLNDTRQKSLSRRTFSSNCVPVCQDRPCTGLEAYKEGDHHRVGVYSDMIRVPPKLIALMVILLSVSALGGHAWGSIMTEEAVLAPPSEGESACTSVPGSSPCPFPKVVDRDISFQSQPVAGLTGSGASSPTSTTSSGPGPASLVSFVCLLAPALNDRLAGEFTSPVSNPPPRSLFRPPKRARQADVVQRVSLSGLK